MNTSQQAQLLEDRLIEFAVQIIEMSTKLDNSYVSQHFLKQIIRSGSAPALLYGEARSAESIKDFRHKVSLVLKELRETIINLKIINRAKLVNAPHLEKIEAENNELISIFVATVRSLDKKLQLHSK